MRELIRRPPSAFLLLSAFAFPAALSGAAPAGAHGVGNGPADHLGEDWLLAWAWDPWVLVPLLLAGGLYLRGWRRLRRATRADTASRRREAWAFGTGWLAAFLALCSPVDPLGEELFSAHMVQHEVLMTLAAPLLVLGRPLASMLWALPPSWRGGLAAAAAGTGLRAAWRGLTRPAVAFWLQAGVLWGWHVPLLFQASLASNLVHTVQHLSFFGSALLFWASLLDRRQRGAGQGAGVLYLFGTAVHGSLLGALLTFSRVVWYPAYAGTTAAWGLMPIEDQQLGGLIMWVPAGLSYLTAGLALLTGALAESELRVRRRESNPQPRR